MKNRFIKGNRIPIKIHTCAKMYAVGNNNTGKIIQIKKNWNGQKCPKGCTRVTFTFMHLADAFIQSNLQCIQIRFYIFISSCLPGKRTHDPGVASAMPYYLSNRKAVTQIWVNVLASVNAVIVICFSQFLLFSLNSLNFACFTLNSEFKSCNSCFPLLNLNIFPPQNKTHEA